MKFTGYFQTFLNHPAFKYSFIPYLQCTNCTMQDLGHQKSLYQILLDESVCSIYEFRPSWDIKSQHLPQGEGHVGATELDSWVVTSKGIFKPRNPLSGGSTDPQMKEQIKDYQAHVLCSHHARQFTYYIFSHLNLKTTLYDGYEETEAQKSQGT